MIMACGNGTLGGGGFQIGGTIKFCYDDGSGFLKEGTKTVTAVTKGEPTFEVKDADGAVVDIKTLKSCPCPEGCPEPVTKVEVVKSVSSTNENPVAPVTQVHTVSANLSADFTTNKPKIKSLLIKNSGTTTILVDGFPIEPDESWSAQADSSSFLSNVTITVEDNPALNTTNLYSLDLWSV